MHTEFIGQFAHTWRVFERLVCNFDPDAWIHTGRGLITPARLSIHILGAGKYYIQDTAPLLLPSGKALDFQWETIKEEELPSQEEIIACIHAIQQKTEAWLTALDLNAENQDFPWAGKTKLGVVLFTLRHMLYHLGELSSLLNESKKGVVEDNYVKAL